MGYEDYIENVLRRDLEASLCRSKQIALKLDDLRALRTNVQMLKKKHDLNWDDPGAKSMDTMINLGIGHVFAKAHVADTSKIFVEAGLGFYVEMTLKECLEFLDQKEK